MKSRTMPIRVLNLTKSTGGLAKYNQQLIKSIDREIIEIDFICLSDENVQFAQLIHKMGFEAIPLDMERYSINIWSDLKLIWKLREISLQGKYDLLLGHGSKAGFLVRVVGRLISKPAIYGLHTMSFLPRINGLKSYVYWFLELIAARIGGHIVTLSNATKETLSRLKIAPAQLVSVIYTGVDVDYFEQRTDPHEARLALGLEPSRPVIGWAARFVPQKAPLKFIEAMKEVCTHIPDVQIFMAGEGPLREQMLILIRELGLRSNFVIAPWQNDVRLVYSALDVFVLNSHWEGLPITLLEVMAMGISTVATDVDGTGEVIQHDKNGYLIKAGDTSNLAEYTIRLLKNAELRSNIGQQANQRISSMFTVEKMCRDWEDLFVNLTLGRHGATDQDKKPFEIHAEHLEG